MSEGRPVNRRQFMTVITAGIGVFLGLFFGIPAVAYIIGPALKKEGEQNWIPLGSTSKVELGVPTLFKTKIQRQTGWIIDEEELSVYVLTENGRDFIAMSNICTHLGCRVRWIDDREEFFCPCHNGVFDKNGQIVSGPVPRPLDQYQTKVEEGQLFILGG
ncbi:MAG: Rieske 2Fe-2S domain-containing protein [Anaerolineales bacterium]|nr:Rieske 2Fe-2S domain-containing protein [Anaerolineales bacterium]